MSLAAGMRMLASIPIAWYVAFFAAPMMLTVLVSITGDEHNGARGFGAYANAIAPQNTAVFADTTLLALSVTAICVLVGCLFAYTIARIRSSTFRYTILALLLLPYFTNFLMRTFAWRLVFAPTGVISESLLRLGVIDTPLDVLDTRGMVMAGLIANWLPLCVLPIYAAMDRVPKNQISAAQDLGSGRIETWWRVVIPQSASGIAAGALLVFVAVMGDMVTPAILGGVRGGLLAGTLVERQFTVGQNWPFGSALAVLMIAITTAVVLIVLLVALSVRHLHRRLAHRFTFPTVPAKVRSAALAVESVFVRPAAGALVGGVLVLLYGPILFVIAYSFNTGKILTRWQGFGIDAYRRAFSNADMLDAFGFTIRVGLMDTAVAVLVGVVSAIAIARSRRLVSFGLTAVFQIVLAAPAIVGGIGFLLYFSSIGLDDAAVRIVLAHSISLGAFVAFLTMSRFSRNGARYEQAAADLGSAPIGAFLRVTLPTAIPVVAATATLAFATSIDEVVIASFLSRPGATPLAVYMFATLKNQGLNGAIAAASCALLAIILATMLVAFLIFRVAGGAHSGIDRLIRS